MKSEGLGSSMTRLTLALVMALAACGSPKPAVLYGPERQLSASAYPEVLRTWTRSTKLYQGFDSKMFVTATFHSPEFRRAFAIAFPEIYGHGGNITRRELVDLTGDVEQFHNFFLSVYTPETKWNDLALPDSIWRVNLIGVTPSRELAADREVAVDPASIDSVRIDANLRAVYPYMSIFDRAYLVRFPLTDAMKRLVLDASSTRATLRIASALGVAELRWDFAPAADGRTEPPAL